MPDSVLVNAQKIAAADTVVSLYVSPASGQGTVITAMTVSNSTNSSASYKAYIYDSTEAMVDAIVPMKIVVRDRYDLAPSAVNHVIPAGGSLRAENSAANSLSFTLSGREQ